MRGMSTLNIADTRLSKSAHTELKTEIARIEKESFSRASHLQRPAAGAAGATMCQ